VRLRAWAAREARRDYDETYPYTDEQRARNEKWFAERARWLEMHGPYEPLGKVEKGRARPVARPRDGDGLDRLDADACSP
jgi:hypothetical protein